MNNTVLETESERRWRLLQHAVELGRDIPAAVAAVGLDAGQVMRWILQGRFDDSSHDLLIGLQEAIHYASCGTRAPSGSDAAIAAEAALVLQQRLVVHSAVVEKLACL